MNKCKICDGIFGTHNSLMHLEFILAEIKRVKSEYPDEWKYKLDFKLIKSDVAKYTKKYKPFMKLLSKFI